MDIQKEQMRQILRTHMNLPQPLVAEMQHYSAMTVDYWKLVDMLVEGTGLLCRDGLVFVPILRGKAAETGMQQLRTGCKSGSFKISFRSWKGKMNFALIREELV